MQEAKKWLYIHFRGETAPWEKKLYKWSLLCTEYYVEVEAKKESKELRGKRSFHIDWNGQMGSRIKSEEVQYKSAA